MAQEIRTYGTTAAVIRTFEDVEHTARCVQAIRRRRAAEAEGFRIEYPAVRLEPAPPPPGFDVLDWRS